MNLFENILFINLKHRKDRLKNSIKQLNLLKKQIPNINWERFEAIKHDNGAIGCAMSHLECLYIAKEKNWEHVFICEDDIVFSDIQTLVNSYNKFISDNIDFDVLIIGGNNFQPYTKITNEYCKISNCQSTTGYIINKHYYNKLIDIFKQSIDKLTLTNDLIYSIDRSWKTLQQNDTWYLLTPLTVHQLPGISDICKSKVNTKNALLSNKLNLFENTLFINLKHRKDRLKNSIKQLNLLKKQIPNINWERFEAIKHDNGAIGCAMSHLECLYIAKEKNWEHVFICEDDIVFSDIQTLVNSYNKFISDNIDFDVLIIGGNNFQPYTKITNEYCKISNCQSTTGYIINKHYYNKLIDIFKQSIDKLTLTNDLIYSIDRSWKTLQQNDTWYLLTPLTVHQLQYNYSDICKANNNTKNTLLYQPKNDVYTKDLSRKYQYDNIIILVVLDDNKQYLNYFMQNTVYLFKKYLLNSKLVIIKQNTKKYSYQQLLNICFDKYYLKTNFYIINDISIMPNERYIKRYYNLKNDITRLYCYDKETLNGIVKIHHDALYHIIDSIDIDYNVFGFSLYNNANIMNIDMTRNYKNKIHYTLLSKLNYNELLIKYNGYISDFIDILTV